MRHPVRAFVWGACCLCMCMLAARPVSADPVAVIAQDKADDLPICSSEPSGEVPPEGLSVCNILIEFGGPADTLLSIGFSDVTTDDPQGFFQHSFGGDTSPGETWISVVPDLVCDTYVDIGLVIAPGTGGSDTTSSDPDFLWLAPDNLVGGWFNSNPLNGQGMAGNYPDNQVFIAQFAVRPGYIVQGTATLFYNAGDDPHPDRVRVLRAAAAVRG